MGCMTAACFLMVIGILVMGVDLAKPRNLGKEMKMLEASLYLLESKHTLDSGLFRRKIEFLSEMLADINVTRACETVSNDCKVLHSNSVKKYLLQELPNALSEIGATAADQMSSPTLENNIKGHIQAILRGLQTEKMMRKQFINVVEANMVTAEAKLEQKSQTVMDYIDVRFKTLETKLCSTLTTRMDTADEAMNDHKDLVTTEMQNFKESSTTLQTTASDLRSDVNSMLDTNDCVENGWRVFQGSCYKCMPTSVNFHTAVAACDELGSHLVDIMTEEENNFVLGLDADWISKMYTWIGLNDIASEKEWRWQHNNETASYTKWWHGQPAGWRNQNCVIAYMNSNSDYNKEGHSYWYDVGCDHQTHFVCKLNVRL